MPSQRFRGNRRTP